MYLRPEAKMTKVIIGRTMRSGALEERKDPTSTAGTLPTMIEVVTGEFHMAEGQRTECRRTRQRHRLGEIGADELIGSEKRVHEQQQDDDQRPRADGGDPHDDAPEHPDRDRGKRADDYLVDRAGACVTGPVVKDIAQGHRYRTDQECCAQRPLHVVLGDMGLAHQVEEIGAEKRHRDRANDHPSDEAKIDRSFVKVHCRSEGAHHDGGDEVARDSGRRLDSEQQDQHRRHQSTTARAGHADKEPDDGAPEHDVRIQLLLFPSLGMDAARSGTCCWRCGHGAGRPRG